ncbi:unnamed protein product [Orchesella dallaii]|uniref:Gustatory receptor n=1 Tax=Orchesella dallaii TaxID=48710 RepID=A0ABP1PNH9_9HEXA
MKKEKVIKFLANTCFLIPGNVKSPKSWFLSFLSVLSLVGLALAILSCFLEFLGTEKLLRSGTNNGTLLKHFKHTPFRPVAFCIKSHDTNTDTNGQTEGSPVTEILEENGPPEDGPPPRQPEVLEDIVNTSYRILIFAVNIVLRLFLWTSFPSIIEILGSLFTLNDGQSEVKNNALSRIWYDGVQKWSSSEKTYLVVLMISQLLRELDLILQFQWSLSRVGLNSVYIPCIIFQAAMEQAKVLFARELVLEIMTFILLVVLKTFVNALWTVAGKSEEVEDIIEMGSKLGGNEKGKQSKEFLFAKAQAILLNSEKSMGSADGNFILPGGVAPLHEQLRLGSGYEENSDLSIIFRAPQHGSNNGKSFERRVTVETIYSKMNFIVNMYFDLMAVWEKSSKITGFVTLVLFCELTTTFCLNTYITLDAAMTFGLLSGLGSCGIMRAILIVMKLVFVCNTAQELRDMTQVLIDRILKLKLKLLSLPKEMYRKESLKSNNMNSMNMNNTSTNSSPVNCERCRGLGSFLSEMVSYIRSHPFELSALGYFSVSRSSLTTITGVIVTYLVVLVQFQSYASSTSTSTTT